jgi:hypothetical protein
VQLVSQANKATQVLLVAQVQLAIQVLWAVVAQMDLLVASDLPDQKVQEQ